VGFDHPSLVQDVCHGIRIGGQFGQLALIAHRVWTFRHRPGGNFAAGHPRRRPRAGPSLRGRPRRPDVRGERRRSGRWRPWARPWPIPTDHCLRTIYRGPPVGREPTVTERRRPDRRSSDRKALRGYSHLLS
jgi:hypothetical protein